MLAVDISRQSVGRALTLAECQDIKAKGYELLIVGLWDGIQKNPYALETLQNASKAGLWVGGYTALTSSYSGTQAVNMANEAAGGFPLCFLSIDVELDGVTITHINESLIAAVQSKQRPCIYSAYWFWTGHLGNPKYYGQNGLKIRLWNAAYDNDPDYDFKYFPYGDWTEELLCGEQYAGTTEWAGSSPSFSVDFSRFEDDWVTSGPGSINGLLLLKKAWESDMQDTIAGAGMLYNGKPDADRLALYALRQTEKARWWSYLLKGGK